MIELDIEIDLVFYVAIVVRIAFAPRRDKTGFTLRSLTQHDTPSS